MKKTLFLLSALCITLSSYAQGLTEAHLKYYKDTHAKMVDARKEKDYSKMVELSYQQIGFLHSMPKKELNDNSKRSSYISLYYDLACYLSLDGKTDDAVAAFEVAVNNGYRNYRWATKDTDLDPLRSDERFEKLMDGLKNKYDYTTVLKNSGKYTSEEKDSLPTFTYLDKNAPELKNLRKTLNLDSIAGGGNEISKIKNLLHYIHTVVRHDGSSYNPKSKNTLDLIKVCREENRGVNCRMMATMLSECYLAMGMPARFVTCLPEDKTDNDCHVITVVWSKKLNKWVWADPTFDAMMYDDKGIPMNPQEVREAFIAGNDAHVHMSKDANWNGKKKDEAEYFDYMKKNLYWINCPLDNGYDIETNKSSYYISLASGDFKPWANDYLTRCDKFFWASPYQKKDAKKK